MVRLCVAFCLLAGLFSSAIAADSKPAIQVSDAWVRASLGAGGMSAAYMTLTDASGSGDTLVGIATVGGAKASLHETTMDGAMMHMQPKKDLAVPPGGTVALKPGGIHVMITGLPQPLKVGDHLALTLRFAKAGPITVPFEARK